MKNLGPDHWPFAVYVLRIALTGLLALACGAHAAALLPRLRESSASLGAVAAIYATAFFFAAWTNFVVVIVSVYAGRYTPGPFSIGTFTLLLVVAYFFTVSFHLLRTRQ